MQAHGIARLYRVAPVVAVLLLAALVIAARLTSAPPGPVPSLALVPAAPLPPPSPPLLAAPASEAASCPPCGQDVQPYTLDQYLRREELRGDPSGVVRRARTRELIYWP